MLDLSPVTLWSCVFTPNQELLNRTLRVMDYCLRRARFHEAVLFTPLPVAHPSVRKVHIREMTLTDFNIYVNTSFPLHFDGDFAMSIHEDGFPIRWDLWKPEFLAYDYIGAPWPDGVVGNGGFSIESRELFIRKRGLPHPGNQSWFENGVQVSDSIPSDVYLCRTHRRELEAAGIRWAPVELAAQFSTEQTHNDQESFGFHGRSASPEKYRRGWEAV